MAVELRPLSAEDFARRRPSMVAEFARKLSESNGSTLDEATAASERQLAQMLPEGLDTPGQFLSRAVEDGAEVGFIWVAAAGISHPDMAWVGVIEVAPQFRSQGIGSRMMLAAEQQLRDRGESRLGLHVFGSNTGAQRLYARLGYGILNQIWRRPAGAAAPSGGVSGAGSGIELRPLPVDEVTALVDDLVDREPEVVTRDPEATTEAARARVARAVPDGFAAENVLARAAYADGRRVGWIWFGLPSPYYPGLGMINYLTVDEAERRRGHGRAMVAAAAAELAGRGVPYVGLDVPGTRPAALAFAAHPALGLELISQLMVKPL